MKGHWSEKEYGYDNRHKIVLRWTCCDACHSEHKSLFIAKLHYLWLRIINNV